jgi:SSS family solute:Na+ symporter
MSSWHIGLSVVATDVGGGFSIGLGGLGFTMGISGSWMLFTGLLGAWFAVVFLIPKVRNNKYKFYRKYLVISTTESGASWYYFCNRIYRFTSSQVLAGAKLASATIDGLNIQTVDCYGRYRGLYFHWRIKSSNLYRYYPMVNSYRWLSIYRNTSCL